MQGIWVFFLIQKTQHYNLKPSFNETKWISHFSAHTPVVSSHRSLSCALCPNQMHPVFPRGNHQNLLNYCPLIAAGTWQIAGQESDTTECVSGLWGQAHLQPNDTCVRLARPVHDKPMQFQRCLRARGDFSDAAGGWFTELCRVPRFESLGAWKGFTWQATNNYTLLFPLYSIILPPLSPGCELLWTSKVAFYFDHNTTKHCSFLIW